MRGLDLQRLVGGGGLDWTDLVRVAAAVLPGRALVGYERGADLEGATAAGFTALGPQRIWVR